MISLKIRTISILHFLTRSEKKYYQITTINLIRNSAPITVIEAVSGDTQATIFKRYSHMFEGNEVLVLKALEQMKKDPGHNAVW